MKTVQCILFGAGIEGKSVLKKFKDLNLDEYIYGFCDSDEQKAGSYILDKPIISYIKAKELNLPIVISVRKEMPKKEITELLSRDKVNYFSNSDTWLRTFGLIDDTTLNRYNCAAYHIDAMDPYFTQAEHESRLKIFWGNDSPFYRMFRDLSLDNVIELACGRGSHVNCYYNLAKKITLVDILEKNINICRERFKNYDNISYYKNNGYDLKELEDGKYSALFTYDAMVHFEMLDIYEYLKETRRVLQHGGKALFHHSNLALKYDQTFSNPYNPGGRNFMTSKIFAYLAYKAGFEIVDQQVIDWSLPKMDCITLVRKP